MSEAFVTLATTDEYVCGALVWAHSLREAHTTKQICCMVTKHVSSHMQELCRTVFDHVELVDVFDSKDEANLKLLARPELGVTFTKLHCWRLTQYTKAVFMDADTVVLQNIDDLFERDELSAAPDPGWPDCFNSGVFVFKPNSDTYAKLIAFAVDVGSFDGGDQGLLNLFFPDWATRDIRFHLPFVYNVISQALYSYPPALARFRNRIRVVHFIGAEKPWTTELDKFGQVVFQDPVNVGTPEFLQYWWHLFFTHVQPKLSKDVESSPSKSGLLNKLATLEIQVPCPPTVRLSEEATRQLAWERGQMDYMGSDSFEKIQSLLETNIQGPPKS